jgi:hypothetical protein
MTMPAGAPAPAAGTERPTSSHRFDFSDPYFPEAVARPRHHAGDELPVFEPFDEPVNTNMSRLTIWAAAGLALVALVEAIAIVALLTRTPSSAAINIPVVIESPEAGDAVVVDGRPTGVTPMQLSVGTSVHSIRIVPKTPPAPAPAVEQPAATADRTAPAAQAAPRNQAALPAPARERSGGLRITSPIEVKVLEGDRVLGSSADGPVIVAAGAHEFDLVNSDVGYRSHQTITIRSGQVAALTITPPEGQVSINASPWAQVLVDGKAIGETPLANVTIAAGRHEITFRHPQFGEQRQSVVVRSGALTRVTASFPR